MNRGEVRWYTFSPPDKRRPVVILTRDPSLRYLNEVTVAAVTSTMRGVPSEVILGQEDGMPHTCAVNLYHIQTIAKAKLGRVITVLSQEKMAQLSVAIDYALDLGLV
ncbi:MAG: type II toxin-antitoxin system PemK/MazF family toxin [Anaerolineae bacterium]